MSGLFKYGLTSVLVQSPIYIVWIIGVILAVVNMKKMKSASILTLIALVIFLIVSIIFTIFNVTYPLQASQNGVATSQIGLVLGITNVIDTFLTIACWVMILVAIFSRRPPQAG